MEAPLQHTRVRVYTGAEGSGAIERMGRDIGLSQQRKRIMAELSPQPLVVIVGDVTTERALAIIRENRLKQTPLAVWVYVPAALYQDFVDRVGDYTATHMAAVPATLSAKTRALRMWQMRAMHPRQSKEWLVEQAKASDAAAAQNRELANKIAAWDLRESREGLEYLGTNPGIFADEGPAKDYIVAVTRMRKLPALGVVYELDLEQACRVWKTASACRAMAARIGQTRWVSGLENLMEKCRGYWPHMLPAMLEFM